MGILRLDVDRQGCPWAIGCDNWTYHWNGKGWDKITGAGFDIAVGSIAVDKKGNPWAAKTSGGQIWAWGSE